VYELQIGNLKESLFLFVIKSSMTEWQEIAEDEKQSILTRLSEIYASHKYPEWLSNPKIVTQIVNILGANQQ
jgi:hypothetical protein